MPRLPRVYIEGAIYYVTCRGIHGEELFRERKDYQMYLELLEKYKREYGFKLFAYVLLPHHLHLLIESTREIGISEIMRSLNTAYSKYFNNRYNRRGHLFRERFKATIVEKQPYLLRLITHIHLNPLRIGLVSDIQSYLYSSYHLYKEGGEGEEVKEVLSLLEGFSYESYLKRIEREEEISDLHKRLQRGGILGSKEFVKKVKEKLQSKGEFKEIEGSRKIYTSVGIALLIVSAASILTVLKLKEEKGKIEGENIKVLPLSIREVKDLDNTEWGIKVTPLTYKGDSFTDTLTFKNGKFISAKFFQQGFKSTNYSVAEEGNKIVWETIQTKGDTSLSWRGELEKDKMQGILSLCTQGQTQDFSFISVRYRKKEARGKAK